MNLDGTVDDVLADPESDRWDGASIELCGGTHAVDAGAAEAFVITQEAAVAKGVRRIEAVTGGAARDALAAGDELVEAAATLDAEDAGEDPAGVARRAKALRKRVDASTCGATVKPKLRLTIEGVQKKLAALEKAEAAKAAGAAGDAVLEAAAAAADAGKTALVTTVLRRAVTKLHVAFETRHPRRRRDPASDYPRGTRGGAATRECPRGAPRQRRDTPPRTIRPRIDRRSRAQAATRPASTTSATC